MPDFGIFRGFGSKLFSDKLYAGQLPTQLGLIGSESFGTDVDALAFFDRVTNAGGTLSATEKLAIDTLVKQMKTDGIWTKMKAIYPMVGASAAACSQNLKSSSFTGSFSSGWTFASTGVKPNGTSAFMNTFLNPTNDLLLNSTHLSYYSRTDSPGITLKGEIGVSSSASYLPLLQLKIKGQEGGVNNSAVSQIWSFQSGQVINVVVSYNSTGFYVNSRNSSTFHKFLRNNTLIGSTTTANNQTTMPNAPINIGRFYNSTNSFFDWTDRECAFASIGNGLDDTEMSNFYTAVQAFQTTLSRQV